MGPRAGLDRCGQSPPPGFDPPTVQPVASRYTDYATLPTRIRVTELINDIANDLMVQLRTSNKIFETYSAEMDKSTDVGACTHFCNCSFCITEEFGINFFS